MPREHATFSAELRAAGVYVAGGRLRPSREARAGGAWALRALLELHAARFPARTDAAGGMVLLEAQDRSLWARERSARGLGHLGRARALRSTSRYAFEAEISALHATAPSFALARARQSALSRSWGIGGTHTVSLNSSRVS